MKQVSNGQGQKINAGLDIGTSNITCAIGQNSLDSKNVKLLGISTIPSQGMRQGVIIHRDKLIESIEQVISDTERMANIKIENIVVSITGEHIRSLNTQAAIPLTKVNGSNGNGADRAINANDVFQVLNLAQAVSLPVDRDILHTLPQEYLVDTLKDIKNPVGMNGRRLEGRVHLVTAGTTAMTNLVRCVEELGITVTDIVFQPLAAGLSTLHDDEIELGITLVDIGSSSTNVAVFHSGAVRHSATIPIGSSSITNDIALMLQVSVNEAESIKMKYASAESKMSSSELNISLEQDDNKLQRSVSEKEISKYVEARMEEIFQMVLREISRADIKNPLAYGLVVTGGGAELRNIVPLAEKALGIKVRKGKPEKIDGVTDIADSPKFSTVMGLLMWPNYTNDHIRMQKPVNNSLLGIFEKIRHTIEAMF